MIPSWCPIWSGIVESSIWEEDDAVCKVFITLLALKGPDHVVRFTAYQIGKKANKTEAEVLNALEVLSAPDKRRIEPQEFEGRRIRKVEGGYLVLNGQKYQEMVYDMKRQRAQAQWMREQRMIERAIKHGEGLPPDKVTPALQKRYARALAKSMAAARLSPPSPGEARYVREYELNGPVAAENTIPDPEGLLG